MRKLDNPEGLVESLKVIFDKSIKSRKSDRLNVINFHRSGIVRENKNFLLAEFKYKPKEDDTKISSVLAVLKSSTPEEITYERRIYGLYSEFNLPYLLKPYGGIDEDVLVLEGFGDVNDFGMNTLEKKLMDFEVRSKISENEKTKVENERKDLFIKISEAIAEMHFKCTIGTCRIGGYGFPGSNTSWSYSNPLKLKEGDNTWSLKKADYTAYVLGFISDLMDILDYKNKLSNQDKAKVTNELNTILEQKGKDHWLFEWIRALNTPVLVHGDLYERNILVGKENQIKFIDFKNAKAGFWVTDMCFSNSPYYTATRGEREDLFSAYMSRLEQLHNDSTFKLDMFNKILPSREFLLQSHRMDDLRQIYWNNRVSSRICRYIDSIQDEKKRQEAEIRLNAHLKMTGHFLNKTAQDGWVAKDYPDLLMLRDYLKGLQIPSLNIE